MDRMDADAERQRTRHGWRRFNWALTLGFIGLVIWLIVARASSIDWHRVLDSLHETPLSALLIAAACSAASYAIYASFDWFARIYTTQVPMLRQFEIAIVSYAFNLNLGALVGSVGFRYRLYSRSGIDRDNIARIVATSMVTNWSGFLLLGGIAFLGRFVVLPQGREIGTLGLQLIGWGLLLALAGYLLMCAHSKGRVWVVRNTEFSLPPLRIAIAQVAASCLNWLTIAAAIWVLLPDSIGFGAVLAVFLLSSVAGAITHVPGGLGVLEAVFIALLGGQASQHQLIAALLAFRAFYYLGPLAIAIAFYIWIEIRGRTGGAQRRRQAQDRERRAPASTPNHIRLPRAP
jgi:uncharacterized membrane protein YbhN (UPF0104 family)